MTPADHRGFPAGHGLFNGITHRWPARTAQFSRVPAPPPIYRPDRTSAGLLAAPPGNAARWLRCAAGVGFTGLMIFAPLNFGSTRDGGMEILTAVSTGAVLLWVASLLCGARTRVPFWAAAAAAWFTLAALPWITALASLTAIAPFTRLHFAQVVARWPYSIVWRTPGNTLPFTLALAASALALIDLARTRAWALAFSIALTGTAAAVGLLALLQNYTHATGIYWRDDGRMPGNFAGTFFHHTAAGAYFNTAWPLAGALTWVAWDRADRGTDDKEREKRDRRIFLGLAALGSAATIILLAAHASHVSRLPQLLALLVAPFLLGSLKIRSRRRWFFAAGGAAAVVLLIALTGRTAEIAGRWRLMFATPAAETALVQPPESAWPALMRDDLFIPNTRSSGWLGDRSESWRTAMRSIAARPFTGHGPGNWMGAASRNTTDPFVRTFFQSMQFCCQDLLQFAVEWGVPAVLGWWGLLAGAVVAVIATRGWFSPLHRPLGIAAGCALAAVLLQSQVDFPLEMPAIAFNAIVLAALCWAGATAGPPASASRPFSS